MNMTLSTLQTPAAASVSFKSRVGDARPFLLSRPATSQRTYRTAIVPMARGPSLKPKNNIAKVRMGACPKRDGVAV